MAANTRGAFIVVEGLDGAGTTTQVHLLSAHLRALGFRTWPTREPSGGALGAALREGIQGRDQFTPEAFALGFAADRLHHMYRPGGVEAMLRDGVWVISDRYVLSSLAYQAAQGVGIEWLALINHFAPTPDVTVFIDTPMSVCLERIRDRGDSSDDVFQRRRMFSAIRREYANALAMGRFTGILRTVDGRGSKESVLRDVFGGVADALHRDFGLLADVVPT